MRDIALHILDIAQNSVSAGANPSMDFLYRHTVEDFEYICTPPFVHLIRKFENSFTNKI